MSPSCTVVPVVWPLAHSEITLVFVVLIIGFLTSVGGSGSSLSTPFTVTLFAVSFADSAGTSFPSLSFTVPKLSIVTLNVIVNFDSAGNE